MSNILSKTPAELAESLYFENLTDTERFEALTNLARTVVQQQAAIQELRDAINRTNHDIHVLVKEYSSVFDTFSLTESDD